MVTDAPLKFGVFITPFHPTGQSPTVALEYDMERVVALDRLGYDEAWFGEHHSGGYELIACPEVFIAAAAGRTKHIRLGTGVVSLPYHHPLMVADRWVLLDHLTRGRVMFGTGPGALPSDAYMMGIDPIDQRRMMQESLEAILALLRAAPGERIDRHSDWFTLRDAQLHIRPYTWPYPEISTAAMISPSGPRLAGSLGTSLLSLSMSVPGGYAALENTWQVVCEQAAKVGRAEPNRRDWRVLSIMHLSDTRDQAIQDCIYGLPDFSKYFGAAGFVPLSNATDGAEGTREFVEDYAAKGNCCIGTPEDAIAYIEDLLNRSGGFGTLLLLGHDWASPQATFHSYDLFARKVIPYFKGQLEAPRASHEWARDKREDLIGRAGQAVVAAITEHVARFSSLRSPVTPTSRRVGLAGGRRARHHPGMKPISGRGRRGGEAARGCAMSRQAAKDMLAGVGGRGGSGNGAERNGCNARPNPGIELAQALGTDGPPIWAALPIPPRPLDTPDNGSFGSACGRASTALAASWPACAAAGKRLWDKPSMSFNAVVVSRKGETSLI